MIFLRDLEISPEAKSDYKKLLKLLDKGGATNKTNKELAECLGLTERTMRHRINTWKKANLIETKGKIRGRTLKLLYKIQLVNIDGHSTYFLTKRELVNIPTLDKDLTKTCLTPDYPIYKEYITINQEPLTINQGESVNTEKESVNTAKQVESELKAIGYSGDYKDWLAEQFLKQIQGKKIGNLKLYLLAWLKDKDPPRLQKPVEYEIIRQPENTGQTNAQRIVEKYGSIANYKKYILSQQEHQISDNRNLESVLA